jgi:hypothetical protein
MVVRRIPEVVPELLSDQTPPAFRSLSAKPQNRLERLLSGFADIRPGEGLTAVMMMAQAFLLMGACYLLKPVCWALVLSGSGVR